MNTEFNVQNAQRAVERGEKLKELFENPLFKEIIEEWYYKDEAARLAAGIANPEMQGDIDQRVIVEMIKGIGHLQNFFLHISQTAYNMEVALKEHKENEVRAQKTADAEIVVDPITGDEVEVKEDE